MGVNDITLAGGMRTNLLDLQSTSALFARTSQRLASGLRVNSAVDDAASYFAAQGHRGRAADLSARKDEMGEAVQTVGAADSGIKAITSLIEQAKGLVTSARSATTADRATLATQFDNLLTQIDNLATDSGYKGTNLLNGDTLTVSLNEDGSSSVDVTGFDATSGGLAIAGSANAWAGNADLDAAAANLDTAVSTLRVNAKGLGASNGVISARQSFTQSMINTLTTGADNLTVADPNEEGANMLALQTRTQLGIAALSLSNQQQQAVMRLF